MAARYESNLFAIDMSAIEEVLLEANSALIERVSVEIARVAGMFSQGQNPNLKDAVNQYGRLQGIHKEVSAARLSDGRPFSEASKRVKDWFNDFEDQLKASETRLKQIIDEVVVSDASDSSSEGKMIGQNLFGKSVVTVRAGPDENPTTMHIPTIWEIDSVDRESVDLEALRPYFTDHCLKLAANKHLDMTRNHSLCGISYKKSAKL